MRAFLRRRQRKKRAREILHHVRYLRHMREDVMEQGPLKRLEDLDSELRGWLREGNLDAAEHACDALGEHMVTVAPTQSHSGIRENVEILAVALAVAMGVRTYFLQPFKIPTGSMQPTLNGITSVSHDSPGLTDRMPLKYIKWMIAGDFYWDVRAKASGHVKLEPHPRDPSVLVCSVDGKRHRLPVDAYRRQELLIPPGGFVRKGDRIWSGTRKAGDHVFVNRLIWNLRSPLRGEVIVFSTHDIPSLPEGTHYIKRLAGLPAEKISITEPQLLIDGVAVDEPLGIARIAAREPGYDGYKVIGLAQADSVSPLRADGDSFLLGEKEYFALGDNTGNSRDSRYWGAVPQANLVGPALVVYWPLTSRWGLIR